MSSNTSGFTVGNPNAPDGQQVAYIKNNGSISQSVYLAAGFYNISFLAAQRDRHQTQYQSIEVLVDGVEVGTATPAMPASGNGQFPAGTRYGSYATSNFTVTGRAHTIEFLGLNPTGGLDNTAFIDEVQLNV